ncbi:MAG: FliM/FliN family flagellar motor switch protein [Pseudomonadota bacterium]
MRDLTDENPSPERSLEALDIAALIAGLPDGTCPPDTTVQRGQIALAPQIAVSVELSSAGELRDAEPNDLALAASAGDLAAHLRLPRDLVGALARRFGFSIEVAAQSESTLAMVTEYLLATAAQPLERALNGDLRLIPTADEPTGDEMFSLVVTVGDERHQAMMSVSGETARKIRHLFPAPVEQARVQLSDAMAIPVAVQSPGFDLCARDLDAFCPGDVLLLDPRWRPEADLALVSGAQRLGTVERDGAGRYTLAAVADPTTPKPDERTETMATPATLETTSGKPQQPSPAKLAAPAGSAVQSTLDTLTVTVSVEVDRTEMTLADLRSLAVGSVLEFEGDGLERVAILANGTPLAKGELVRVGDRTGVRLVALD